MLFFWILRAHPGKMDKSFMLLCFVNLYLKGMMQSYHQELILMMQISCYTSADPCGLSAYSLLGTCTGRAAIL